MTTIPNPTSNPSSGLPPLALRTTRWSATSGASGCAFSVSHSFIRGSVPITLHSGKAKKLWTKSTPGPVTLAVSISSESFEALHISFYEETEGSFDWTPNSAYLQDAFPDSPCAACDLYNVDSEGEYERGYESPSVFSEDSGHLATSLSHQYQDLSDILEESHYEWETADDTEFRALLEVEDDTDHISSESGAENDGPSSVPEARDDNDTWTWSASGSHRDDETSSFLAIPNQGNNWTAASPISTYFCPPTPASTLAPLTPSGSGFRPSTPVLVHESTSYEEALFAEFKEMIASKGVKGNGA